MGSTDRRLTSQFIYNYFRTGDSLKEVNREERLALSSFLVNTVNTPLLDISLKKCTKLVDVDVMMPLELKVFVIKKYYPAFLPEDIFPFAAFAGGLRDLSAFKYAILQQPYLWLRSKKLYKDKIIGALEKQGIAFVIENNSIGIKHTVDLKKVQSLESDWFEIQDWSSQQTGNYFKPQAGENWFDCCAASGGKSLLLHSLQPNIRLTVSDNRESSLNNLKVRFQQNKLTAYSVVKCDLSDALPIELSQQHFDGIIADVPCTGSGTWARSPEQLTFFDIHQLKNYTDKQRSILRQIIPTLKKGKPLIYITCSVFKEENEDLTAWLAEKYDFEFELSTYLEGATFHADTMYLARLIKK